MLSLFKRIIRRRRKKYIDCSCKKYIDCSSKNSLHLEIVRNYLLNFSTTCDFGELPYAASLNDALWHNKSRFLAKLAAASAQELREFFKVPRLKKFHESKIRIKKYQLVEAFFSFLLQLLFHKTDCFFPYEDQIDNLEKELRFLLTILGDTSLMLCDENEEFQNLLAEFEAVANEAGSLVHSILFSVDDGASGKMNEGIGVVLNHIDLLKANIMKFLNLLSSISRSAYIAPKTSFVDSLLIVNSLIHDLEDLRNRKDNSIADVNQIKILHQWLIFLQSSIKDIGSPQHSEIGELKEPLMRIGDMAHEAEYLIVSFLVGDVPLWYLINRLTDVNHNIELVGTELQEITQKYKFGDLKVAKYFSAQLSLQAKRNTEVDVFTVGFDDRATDILHQLVGGAEHLQVISIFGMPGLGKTTLAKKLYNHPLVNYTFDKLSWCVVSQTYTRQSILADILIHIESELDKDRILKMEEERLAEHIYKTLKGRKYLIVMDDIWDSNVWDDLRRCFPDDGNGSRILFTTRNKDVAPPNSIIYALPSLSNDQCWELLEKKVFHDKSCPPELLGIGKKIAANCYGLPLSVVVIAGILSTMDKEKSTWEEVGGNLASYIFDGGDNSVMQILELSYKHLPNHLKPCFLYFGAFREDEEIPIRKLMRLWIAEGLIRKEEEKSAENVAEEYLMELIDKSLAMVAKRRSDGGVKACVIHDLLRDLCLKRSEEENFLKFVNSDDYPIYKKGNRLQVLEHSINSSYCQQVRSFHGSSLTSPFYVRDMRLLRVLHFDHYQNGHFIGIEFLVNLRYLVITDLPASIDRLVNLEYLRVKTGYTSDTVYIPPAIMKMRKLRYLEVLLADAKYAKDCNSSQTNNLEFLSGICIGERKDEEMLRCSPHLRKLKSNIEPDQDFDLRFLTQLESLHITFNVGLQEINFPSNIKKLTLYGCGSSSSKLPREIGRLDGCERSFSKLPREIMSIIGRLEHLEVLKLGYIDSLEEESWHTRNGEFQKLRFLKLDQIINLTQWKVDSSEHFPKLQQFVLKDCFNLHEIPSEIGEVATLQLIEVKGRCRKSVGESAKRIQQDQREMGNEELRVIVSTD